MPLNLRSKPKPVPDKIKTPVDHLVEGLNTAFEDATANGEIVRMQALMNQCKGVEMGIMAMHAYALMMENTHHGRMKSALAHGASELGQAIAKVITRCEQEKMPSAGEFAQKFATTMPATESPKARPVNLKEPTEDNNVADLAKKLTPVAQDADRKLEAKKKAAG